MAAALRIGQRQPAHLLLVARFLRLDVAERLVGDPPAVQPHARILPVPVRFLRALAEPREPLEPGPVVLVGASLGAAVALQTAAVDRRVSAVVAAETFSDLRTVAGILKGRKVADTLRMLVVPGSARVRLAAEAERAARHVRKVWKLGETALSNVHELLEERGVKMKEVEADEANDPLLHAVRLMCEAGALSPAAAVTSSKRMRPSSPTLRQS